MDRRRRLITYYVVLVVGVLSGYSLLYNYGMAAWEGRPEPLYRSIQVVIQTVTTVGFGGDAPWTSPGMNYLVAIMELSGLVLIFAALPVLVVPLFEDAFRSSAPTAVDGLEDHVVICSYGPREEVLVDELARRGVEYVIISPDRDTATDLHTDGYSVIYGDPESDATLRNARLEHAAALIADVDDETNPSILLAVREVDPEVLAISLVEEPRVADFHRYAGADHVLSPRQLLGENLADKAIGTFSSDAVEAVEIDEDFEIAEFPLQSGSELIGRTITDSGIRERTGATVVGAWFRGEFESPPPPDGRFDARSVVLAAGTETELDRLKGMTLSEGRRRPRRVIIVGMGVVGRAVASGFAGAEVAYTTVDIVDDPVVDVVGDATEPQVLSEAGIENCGTVVIALSDDTTAIYTTFLIRKLNPGVEIIARANELESVSKLYRAGADYVLSIATVSGRMLASIVLDEEIISPDTGIKLIRTRAPGLDRQSLADADIPSRTGCTVIAVERNGRTLTDFDGTFVVEPDDELVIAGTDANTDRFLSEFA